MTLSFSLPYRTTFGQRLVLAGSLPGLGSWQLAGALPLAYDEATTRWSGTPGATRRGPHRAYL
ncbi:MAG: carbohydrate-binding module family 20 domain-containing protein [Hymenobacter sp.]